MSDVKILFRSQALFSLVNCTFFLLGWFHSLLSAFFGIYPTALESPTSVVSTQIRHKLHSFAQWPPFRNITDRCLVSLAFLSHEENFITHFFYIYFCSQNQTAEAANFFCLLELEHGTFIQVHLH